MEDDNKTKEQLVKELMEMHQRVAGLEAQQTERRRIEKALRQCSAALQARNQDLDDLARYVVSEFRSPLGVIIGFAELLEEDYAMLSDEELCHSIRTIKQSGRKLGQMANVLLLLASSHRLFDNVWYAAYLAAMGEASLSQWAREENVPEAYRFTCLPTSAAPLVIRVWATGNEIPHLQAIAKLGSDLEGYENEGEDEDEGGPASLEAEWTLAAEEWDSLLAAVEESEFWTGDSSLEQLGWLKMVGTDGEEWIFEGWRDGQHKARMVGSPGEEKARAAYALGRSFLKSLPGWFALEMARLWAADSWPKIHPRLRSKMDLGSLQPQPAVEQPLAPRKQ
jgi:hypothetical protein